MKNLKCLHASQGFTTAEALVMVLIYSIISGACYVALLSGNTSWQVTSVQTELQQELRKGMDAMTEDLRQAGSSSITNVSADGLVYPTITFKICTGVSGGNITWSSDTVQYVLGTGANANRLLRNSGAQSKVIAQNIQTLQIVRNSGSPNIVEVSILARKNTSGSRLLSMNSSFSVKLRN